uniref:Uncharacterized protein n=1 Tax=Loa loa TaxID=7209 RepID=A0A1I7V7B1_LOALO
MITTIADLLLKDVKKCAKCGGPKPSGYADGSMDGAYYRDRMYSTKIVQRSGRSKREMKLVVNDTCNSKYLMEIMDQVSF